MKTLSDIRIDILDASLYVWNMIDLANDKYAETNDPEWSDQVERLNDCVEKMDEAIDLLSEAEQLIGGVNEN